MPNPDLERLRGIKTFPSLVKYLRDDLDWPIESEDFDDLTFDFEPEELGIDPKTSAKIESIKQLRPLSSSQPWGIFFVKFEPKKLPVVALRRILGQLVIKKRASANQADQQTWKLSDLLFLSNYGENEQRQITFAHFSGNGGSKHLPTLKVLGWDDSDTTLHMDYVHATFRKKLRWPDDKSDLDAWRKTWSSAFTLRHREVIDTSKILAIKLAGLAQKIRKRANSILSIEVESGPLRKLMAGFKEALVHDLTEDSFSDMYAQTIAYGLLTARITNPKGDNPDELSKQMPITNPFLKELMESFLSVGGRKRKSGTRVGIDFDELGINEVVELLDNSNMEAVVRDFGDNNPLEDPVIHFYELFLEEYDHDQKAKRGVFYTPRSVVSFIVRSVDEKLRTEFKLEDGLADISTWGEMVKKNKDLKIPKGVKPNAPFVQILDPATGTGTFLVEVIDLIHKTMVENWGGEGNSEKKIEQLWNDYVPKHLLPRLHGYELLMAPYAIAHMKIGLKLYETNYHFRSDERTRIFLTNALEPAQDFSDRFTFHIPALAHEAKSANKIKEFKSFTVVIGNPPYSGVSSNMNPWIDGLLKGKQPSSLKTQSYYEIDGKPLNERKVWLQDDYVKFIRYAHWCIDCCGYGVVGYITNHAYLDNPTFRGMRQQLMNTFSDISVLDLHGNVMRKEIPPEGTLNKNVFDIEQGVAISLLQKPIHQTLVSRVCHAENWGTRESKNQFLMTKTIDKVSQVEIIPTSTFYFFIPRDETNREEYEKGLPITDVMPTHATGIVTARDNFVVDFKDKPIENRIQIFLGEYTTDDEVKKKLGISENYAWRVSSARQELRKVKSLNSLYRDYMYRPFDVRRIFFHKSVVWRTRESTTRHLLDDDENLALVFMRQVASGDQYTHFGVTKIPIDNRAFYSNKGIMTFAPLYLCPRNDTLLANRRTLNLSKEIIKTLSENLSLTSIDQGVGDLRAGGTLGPEDIFCFIYAQFYSQGYRSRYVQFLSVDFPRIFLVHDLSFFSKLCQFGSDLVSLHLMESPGLKDLITLVVGSGDFQVEKISYTNDTVWIDKAKTKGFQCIPENIWNFHFGGYQVCHKWLKDRGPKKGKPGAVLTKEDIDHYQKIIVAISETIRIMAEIDEVIEEHGGWPGAFVTESGKE